MTSHPSTRPFCGSSKADQYRQNIDLEDAEKFKVFHLFQKLIPELRIKVWKFSALPRLVDIQVTHKADHRALVGTSYGNRVDHLDALDADAPQSYFRTISRTPVPAILQVDRESRAEMLKLYRMITNNAFDTGGRFYFNERVDTLYCPYRDSHSYDRDFKNLMYNHVDPSIYKWLRSLAVDELDHSLQSNVWRIAHLHARTFVLFDNLEEITVVAFRPTIISSRQPLNPNIGRFQIADLRASDDGNEVAEKILRRFHKNMEIPNANYTGVTIWQRTFPPIKVMCPADPRITRKRSKTV